MKLPIYLDYNATTPVDPRVAKAMIPFITDHFGNASSAHSYGYTAREAVDQARRQVASLIGARPSEIIFTGGGSETNNLAIKGTVFAALDRNPHIVTTQTEHPAVLNTLKYLQFRFGAGCTVVPVDRTGRVSADAIAAALRPDTVLVTVMHANNEVGTIQPIEEIARVTRAAGVLLHVDAAQSTGKIPINVGSMGVDLLTLAGHKLYGPKGVGVLYRRQSVVLDPLVHGSSQESGLRAGTENVAGMVGLGAAAAIAREEDSAEPARLRQLRDRLETGLRAAIPGLLLNGHREHRLPNTLNVSFPGTSGQLILLSAPDIAASTGSACHSGSSDPSPVLLSMGIPREQAAGAIRLSLGRMTTSDEIDRAGAALIKAFRSLAPVESLIG